MKPATLSVHAIDKLINQLPGHGRLWVAFSGGMDSTVLLHLLVNAQKSMGRELRAVHVNHQLSPNSADWLEHCGSVCAAWGVPCELITLDLSINHGHGPEAYARHKRYEAMTGLLLDNDLLLTAHHQDDQAETLLLQLMRGGGPEGLAAMPAMRPLGKGWLVRPLLDFLRRELQEYAVQHKLEWIEDESNLDKGFDRNFLRHDVLPLLRQRWPAVDATLARTAGHMAEAAELLRELAKLDLEKCTSGAKDSLSIKPLVELPEDRVRNLLRYWCRTNGVPVPNAAVLQNIIHEVIQSRQDAEPCIRWVNSEIRRYRDCLYIMTPGNQPDSASVYQWDLHQPLHLETGTLTAVLVQGQGIKSSAVPDTMLEVRFRTGGERIKPAGRKETHTLKHLFQEAGLPPWQRDQVPLLYINNTLAAVAGWWTDTAFQAAANEPGWLITLRQDY